MDSAIDALLAGTAWFWLVLGLILVITEVLAPTFWLLWPGLAALALGLATTITGPFDWRIQGLIFAALSVAATWAGRRYIRKTKTPPEAVSLNRRAEQYVGRLVKVSETFTGGRGRVAIDDTIWIAEAMDATNPAAGETVEVASVEGSLLKIRSRL
jgi:membrane protein implicated in regulation of membrane protease activity